MQSMACIMPKMIPVPLMPLTQLPASHQKYPQIKRINVAGGIDLNQARKLKAQGITETVIVGSKIVKVADPVAAAKEFMKEVK